MDGMRVQVHAASRKNFIIAIAADKILIKADKLPESLLLNPVWHALHTKHRHFANSTADACRYPADVVPFAAVNAPNADALRQLHSLLAFGEST
jgi:hypothetical protein